MEHPQNNRLNSPSENDWMYHEQQATYQYFVKHVHHWLQTSVRFALEHQDNPTVLKKQVQHFYERIVQFYRFDTSSESLLETILRLVGVLHPWPIRWGHFQQWEASLFIAVEIAHQSNQPNVIIKLKEAQAEIYKERNRLSEAVVLSQQSIELARQHGLAYLLGKSAFTWADCMMELQQASKEISNTLLEIEHDPIIQSAVEVDRRLALGYLWLGQAWLARSWDTTLEESLRWANQAINLLEGTTHHDLYLKAELLRVRGFMASLKGHYVVATQDLEAAAQIHTERGADYDEALVKGNLGLIYWLMHNLDHAETAMQRSLELAVTTGAHLQALSQRIDLGLVFLLRGNLVEAQTRFSIAFDEATRSGFVMQVNRLYRCMGLVALGHRDFEAARCYLETNLEAIAQRGKSASLANSYANLARIYVRLGKPDHANVLIREAIEIADIAGSLTLRIIVLRAHADCIQNPRECAETLSQVIELAHAHRPLDAAACYLDLAHLQIDEAEAVRLWQMGVNLLQKIGAGEWLHNASIECPPLIVTTI